MKIKFLLPILLIPLCLAAQDDYCSCMETDDSYAELFTSLTQYKEELTLWQRQITTITKTKIVIPPKENVTQVLVEEAFLEEQENEEAKAFEKLVIEAEALIKQENEVDEKSAESFDEDSDKKERVSKINGKKKGTKARIKAKKKRLKAKLKRKKKMRKYRGGCPNF